MFVADCGWLRLPISILFGVVADDDDDDELTKGFTLWILFIHFSLFSVPPLHFFFSFFDDNDGKILKSYSEPSGDAFGE